MIKLNSFQSPRYGSFTFPGTWPFFAGKERSRLFSTDQHGERIRLPEIARSKCEARALTCFTTEIPNQTHILVLSKQDLSTLTRVHGARFQQGTWWLFGSPSSDSLAEDCRLIISRRHWHLLNALTNVHERKASCFLNNEWFETLIQSSSSIRLRRRGMFLSLLLAKTAKKLQRPLNRESASATCKCHGGDAKSTTIFVWFWHRFFFF